MYGRPPPPGYYGGPGYGPHHHGYGGYGPGYYGGPGYGPHHHHHHHHGCSVF